MQDVCKQKLKLLYLYKYLQEETDAVEGVTVNQIIEYLASQGISCGRKTVYSDIKLLQSFDSNVAMHKSFTVTYHLVAREFELPEIKILCDLVSSSKFITEKKSAELTHKLSLLTPKSNATSLKREIIVRDRTKSDNEMIYSNIDTLHSAIRQKKQISFHYYEYVLDSDLNKQLSIKRGGERYVASPYLLVCENQHYYLVAYYKRYDRIVNFRIDKMEDITIEGQLITVVPTTEFNPIKYKKKLFTMYGGKLTSISLLMDNSLLGVVIDRFGKDIKILPHDNGSFSVKVDVEVSDAFLGWMFQFGKQASILSPKSVSDEYKRKIKDML